jgi:putative selenium metabolism hydrolase
MFHPDRASNRQGGEYLFIKGNELIGFCQRLIQVESLSGKEEKVASLVSGMMQELGYDEVKTDRLGNVIGTIHGRGEGPTLLLESYMDIAPVVNAGRWAFDPYAAEIDSGRIYGRGAASMKGALAAMVFAAAQLKQAGIEPDGSISVAATVLGVEAPGAALREVMDAVKPDMVVIGQGTDLNVHIGGLGRAIVRATSRAANVTSRGGSSARAVMDGFRRQLRMIAPQHHAQLGQADINEISITDTTMLESTVNEECSKLLFRKQLLLGEHKQALLEQFAALSDTVRIAIDESVIASYTGASQQATQYYPSWLLDIDHPLIEGTMKALNGQGIPAKISTYRQSTSGSYSAGAANVPTVGFGPSLESLAKSDNEYIEMEQLIKAAQGYYAIAKAFAIAANLEGVNT